ncbi:unnamed protein product [Rotaria socialis]|uniref:Uncharacterized protein n=1 Tax=Rotaria socialis TaxID=392032 RepID=A0A818CGX9_9BILA|nr:unnamed protein product [Rotaria socialis]CAF3420136.1 unnamed protein product [Rotaria socialis]CAF3430124.1 unnamed protein product [Rotaria socialis]CAF3490130.1 unnamed protein product [Rotaria socialis]CAF3503932.1 unnamed protein product [Rotaria socialis]
MSRITKVNPSNNATTSTSSPVVNKKSQSSSSLITLMRLKNQNRRPSVNLSDKNLSTVSTRLTASKYVAEQRAKARDIVLGLQNKNIKLIAIDFDNTFLSIHTNGYYQGTADSLLSYIRSAFHYLIQELLESSAYSQTLHVCFVSFSSQEQLIRKLLHLAFKTSKTDRIIIRCNTPEFVANMDEDFLGKEYHLSSVVTEIATRRNKTIKPNEILLLDDDVQNILIAEKFGHKVLEIRDEISLDILKDFVYNNLPDS